MRFPFSLTISMATYMLRKKLRGFRKGGTAKFPLVLMLEPLHACNLQCSGCGRIREYADSLGQRLSVDECLHAVKECGAPIVSICGGEPLLYPEIVELTDKILRLGKHIYLCTNGILLEKKIGGFVHLAKRNRRVKNRLYWNVHLDGTSDVHDAIVGKPGMYRKTFGGILRAKREGFYVYTNTTLYRTSSIDDLVHLAEILHMNNFMSDSIPKIIRRTALKIRKEMQIDGMMIAPGYGYDAVLNNSPTPPKEGNIFLNRSEIHELFREVRQRMKKYRLTATPIYMDFLCGERELPCAAWANPTRNVKGWKAPCYLMTDRHYDTFAEFMEQTDWSKTGLGNNPRCQDCMMHCGYEPAAVLFGNRLRDLVRMALWQMGVV